MTNHPIKLRNSASGSNKPEPFVPLDWQDDSIPEDQKRVRMYVCGPTVYDRAHIGNARPAVVFDVLYRLLKHVYNGRVTYVRNITDIDDKINNRAQETLREGETPVEAIRRISNETMRWYQEDMRALGCLDPDHQPRATDYVEQMKAMITKLIADGFAYEVEGHVLFEVSKYNGYGSLSNRSLDEMITSARGETAPSKRAPMDFVLWKPSAPDQPGWDSPWGRGRPGWHIECSAMAGELLGETFDIHGGGADLMFPHHENEIAQSRCACPEGGFARVWMHNGMIRVFGEKMSKSKGNFIDLSEIRSGYEPCVARVAILMSHYRGELDWNTKRTHEAQARVDRWRRALAKLGPGFIKKRKRNVASPEVLASLMDDLNTPAALAELDRLSNFIEKRVHIESLRSHAGLMFFGALSLLGVDLDKRVLISMAEEEELNRQKLYQHINHRQHEGAIIDLAVKEINRAREQKDYKRSDAIRDAIQNAGGAIEIGRDGVAFRRLRDLDLEIIKEALK